ncbi:DUF2141 domain-containing protein [Paucibacter sp. Y2R2-4]|uniref:DUF2141 domain-containing protein n=1 Tax=Paucibacter sp. Y2R2-4 TaxID=2893553 RepID=UPI0021E3AA76|nr:DUF2141 domain-containing protein [Paucibacter sp. Y2R2-4]MCV2352145.1 DUF2141 domain-containing protein [Paucibacter sp. Y2R2-4]
MKANTKTASASRAGKPGPMKQSLLSAGFGTLAMALCAAAGSAQAMDLELEVSGLTQSEGRVMVAVYTDANNWLKKPLTGNSVEASTQKDGRVLIKLLDLPEGLLALSIFHDVNGNGKLDSNAMGMPKEPYGFSNNAAGSFGPPKFEKAQFEAKPGARVSVQLN